MLSKFSVIVEEKSDEKGKVTYHESHLSRVLVLLFLWTFATIWLTACNQEYQHEHNYTQSVAEPTCTEQGYAKYTCSCGDNQVDSLSHSYENNKCKFCNHFKRSEGLQYD